MRASLKTYSNVRSVINLMTLLYAPLEPTNPFLGHHYHHHHHQGVPHFRKNPNNCLFFVLFSRSSTSSWRASVGWLISGKKIYVFFISFIKILLLKVFPSWLGPYQAIRQTASTSRCRVRAHTAILPHCYTATLHTSYFNGFHFSQYFWNTHFLIIQHTWRVRTLTGILHPIE